MEMQPMTNDPSLPVYRCRRVDTPPLVDGDLGKPVWVAAEAVHLVPASLAPGLTADVERARLGPASLDGSASSTDRATYQITAFGACWSDSHLYLAFLAHDRDIWSGYKNRDDTLYEQEVVEAFLSPTGDVSNYYEINISPRNVIFDAKVHSPDLHRGTMTVDTSWDCPGLVTAVRVEGTLNDRSDIDRWWSVEAAISFSAFPETGKPRPGDTWRANFFRIDRAEPPEFTCWSPTGETPANFHVPLCFGTLVYEN
jgi:hypothetical protein